MFRSVATACLLLSCASPFIASAQFNDFFYFPSSSSEPVGAAVYVNGTIYGVTYSGAGGSPLCTTGKDCGTFFQLNKPAKHGVPWTETILYQFKGGKDGAAPNANPIYLNGNFYGTTYGGGSGSGSGNANGTVYAMAPNGSGGFTHSVIYTFAGGTTDGTRPTYLTTLNGNIYGIANGGSNGNGVVFQLVGSGTTWTESIIHNFNSASDGANPQYITAFNGLLYISCASGGSGNGGTVVQLTPPVTGSNWATNIIYAFGTAGDAGYNPEGFTFGPTDGNLYGVAQVGGGGPCTFKTFSGCGTVFKLTNQNRPITWKFQQLYAFSGGADADAPFAPPAFDTAGNIWLTSTGLATSPGGNAGAVLMLNHQPGGWVGTVIETFTGANGSDPGGQLTLNTSNGNMYGYTVHGGASGNGAAYSITTSSSSSNTE